MDFILKPSRVIQQVSKTKVYKNISNHLQSESLQLKFPRDCAFFCKIQFKNKTIVKLSKDKERVMNRETKLVDMFCYTLLVVLIALQFCSTSDAGECPMTFSII